MKNFIKNQSLKVSAFVVLAMMSGVEASHATVTVGTGSGGGQTFSTIGSNITTSIQSLPGLLSGLSYMLGILLGVLGILKIKDHVENPSSEKLSHGAIRLAAGGGLFALPMVYEAMENTIGDGNNVTAAELNKIDFAVTN